MVEEVDLRTVVEEAGAAVVVLGEDEDVQIITIMLERLHNNSTTTISPSSINSQLPNSKVNQAIVLQTSLIESRGLSVSVMLILRLMVNLIESQCCECDFSVNLGVLD